MIFSKELAPPVLGWSSAIASFGAFLIPKFFAIAIQGGTPEAPFFALHNLPSTPSVFRALAFSFQ